MTTLYIHENIEHIEHNLMDNCGLCLQVKPTEVSSVDLENLCRIIQERLLNIPSNPRSLLDDLEVCIGAVDCITSENASVAEISLSQETIMLIGRWLRNEERARSLISSTPVSDGVFGEQLAEQLVRDGSYPCIYLYALFIYYITCTFFEILSCLFILNPTS